MKEQPEVSVILPVYNGEVYLQACLDSLRIQTLTNIEIIIVNDGSTDSSRQIIEDFCNQDSRFFLVEHEHNRGLPAALNTGAKKSSAPLQTWVSHDNFLGQDYLREMVIEIQSSRADIVYSDYWRADSDSNILGVSLVEDIDYIYCGNIIGASFLYRASVEKFLGGYNENYIMFEDYDFFVRAFQKGFKFHKVRVMPYYYRIHNAQLTSTRKLPSILFQYRLELIDSNPIRSAEVRVRAIVSLAHIMFTHREFRLLRKLIVSIDPRDAFAMIRYVYSRIKVQSNLK